MSGKPSYLNYKEALGKAQKYCAYQERCHKEVKAKLRELGIDTKSSEQIMADLITGGFLNEERFARAFAGGKFRTKKWGRHRIIRELKYRDISEYCIQKGLEEIPDERYQETLLELANQKIAVTKGNNAFVQRKKVADFLLRKGYEPDLVWPLLKEIVKDG